MVRQQPDLLDAAAMALDALAEGFSEEGIRLGRGKKRKAAAMAQDAPGNSIPGEDIPLVRPRKCTAGTTVAPGCHPSAGPDFGGAWAPPAPLCKEPDPNLELSQLPLKTLKPRLQSPTIPSPNCFWQAGPSPAAPLHPLQPPVLHPAQACSPLVCLP